MIRVSWVIAIASILLFAACATQDGRLQHVRDDARSSSSSDKSNVSSDDDNSILGTILGGLLSIDDGEGHTLGGTLLTYSLFAPFMVPAAVLGDDYKYHLFFTPHPYANGYRGYQMLSEEMAEMFYDGDSKGLPRCHWGMRLSLEDGNDFRGLNRLNGQLKVEHGSRWGIVSNWNYFRERLPCGCTDETVIGDTNVTFRFAQNEIASLYTGVGFRVLTDRRQTDWGVNFTYGGDWFPVRPLVVSGVFDAGTLGTAGVIHARGTVGAVFHGWEVFAGYDFLQIGRTTLQGPMAGVRWWF